MRHLYLVHAHRAPVLGPHHERSSIRPPDGGRRFGDLEVADEAHGQTTGHSANRRDKPYTAVAGGVLRFGVAKIRKRPSGERRTSDTHCMRKRSVGSMPRTLKNSW